MLDEVGLQPVGGFQRLVAIAQRIFDAEAVGDVGEGDQRGAVGQRRQWKATAPMRSERSISPMFARAPRPATIAWISWSQMLAVAESVARSGGDGAHMRFACQILGVEFPDAGEGGVVQLQLAVGAEHGDAFAERIQRRRLHLDQGVVVAFQRQLRGDVFIEKGQAAEGMGLGHHPDRLAAGQVPGLFGWAVARASWYSASRARFQPW